MSDEAADGVIWAAIWREARERLDAAGIEAADREARWMVEDVAGIPAADVSRSTDTVAARHLARFDQLVERRAAGEPLQYVLGHWAFRRLDLLVDRRVLIPRPETEVVVQVALDELARSSTVAPVALDQLRIGDRKDGPNIGFRVIAPGIREILRRRSPVPLARETRLKGVGIGEQRAESIRG